ncbi:MAG: hypothetical protein C0497_07445 [Gemmatimonas sp.]|nr:hypothetical protein [Gemmatimonas sp.]
MFTHGRKDQADFRPFARRAVGFDASAVRHHCLLHDCQPQPRPRRLVGHVRVPDARQLLRRDAASVVPHGHHDVVVAPGHAHLQPRRRAARLYCVDQHVREGAMQRVVLTLYEREVRLGFELECRGVGDARARHLARHVPEVERRHRSLG